MAGDAHWIMLLSRFLGQKTVVDIKPSTSIQITDDYVHHVREPEVTLDVTLDDMTCVATTPPSNSVIVTGGKAHWYGHYIELLANTNSPDIDIYDPVDCDPVVGGSYRYALLCIYRALDGSVTLVWTYGKGTMRPQVPHNKIPLCYVKQAMGTNTILSEHIENWRTIHPTNAPSTQFLFPPVMTSDELNDYTNVPDMAMAFVLGESNWYFYYNGVWVPQGQGIFSDTFFMEDVTEDTTETVLPWAVFNYSEIMVYRDGFAMAPEKDYSLESGVSAIIKWNQIIYRNMRIMVIRNPFMGSGFAMTTSSNKFEILDLWVDGIAGLDTFPGSQDKPFKTLQRAFDSIPLTSPHKYVVHARRLQLVDKVSFNNHSITCYGVLTGRRVRSLRIEVQDDCEYSIDELDWLYALRDVSFVEYTSQSLYYPILHTDCICIFFTVLWLASICSFAGGQYIFDNVTMSDGTVFVDNAAFIRILNSNIHTIYPRYTGLIQAFSSQFKSVMGGMGGLLQLEYCNIDGGINTKQCNISLVSTTWTHGGNFISSNIMAINCNLAGVETKKIQTPFLLSFNSTLQWDTCNASYITGPAILLQHGSRANVQGGSISNAGFDAGIVVTHNSSLIAGSSLTINRCLSHGIYLAYGSTGYTNVVKGTHNMVYGIYATVYSTCERVRTTLSGNTADYREDSAGSRTVAADGLDEYPLTLDQKIHAGLGIKTEVIPATPPTGNNKLDIGIDIAQFTDVDSPLNIFLDNRPRTTVYRYIYHVPPEGAIDVPLISAGTGFLVSIAQRVNNPVIHTRVTNTKDSESNLFIQMDSAIGTQFTLNSWQLRYRPGVGYAKNSVYFMYTVPQSLSSLPIHTINVLQDLEINADVPPGTFIKCGISINGGRQFKRWSGSSWDNLTGDSVLAQLSNADLHTEVNNYSGAAWGLLKSQFNPMYIDLGFAIMTNSDTVTPKLYSYTWKFMEDGYNLDISEKFSKMFYSTRAVFKNITSSNIQPPLFFTIYPVTDYGR